MKRFKGDILNIIAFLWDKKKSLKHFEGRDTIDIPTGGGKSPMLSVTLPYFPGTIYSYFTPYIPYEGPSGRVNKASINAVYQQHLIGIDR